MIDARSRGWKPRFERSDRRNAAAAGLPGHDGRPFPRTEAGVPWPAVSGHELDPAGDDAPTPTPAGADADARQPLHDDARDAPGHGRCGRPADPDAANDGFAATSDAADDDDATAAAAGPGSEVSARC